MVYLFIGEDSLSKNIKINQLKQELLAKDIEQFNLDILYAKDLTLTVLQERLLCLPVKAKKRLIVIKDAQNLKEDIRAFILKLAKNSLPGAALVLDIDRKDRDDEFINRLQRLAKVFQFKESARLDTFALSRQIELRKPDYALRVLNQLLKNGERPERILGGLRYSLERNTSNLLEIDQRLKLLLNCDLDIKTGRLKPNFALERLVVSLCRLKKSFG
jgi:DNA polymerase III delta subunit